MLSLLIKRKAKTKVKHAPTTRTDTTQKSIDWSKTKKNLANDLMYLKTLAGSEEKNPYKIELIDKYQQIVKSLLASHTDLAQLDVVWWWFVWSIDLGRIDEVYADFKDAIARNLTVPDCYRSNAHTAFSDLIFKHSDSQRREKKVFNTAYLEHVVIDVQSGNYAINAALKSKIFRLAGDIALENGDKEKAVTLFELAIGLDPKCGRKQLLTELKANNREDDAND